MKTNPGGRRDAERQWWASKLLKMWTSLCIDCKHRVFACVLRVIKNRVNLKSWTKTAQRWEEGLGDDFVVFVGNTLSFLSHWGLQTLRVGVLSCFCTLMCIKQHPTQRSVSLCVNRGYSSVLFFFKLYIIVLVLPNIKMNPPQVYMWSPSWPLLPPHTIRGR